MTNCRNYGKAPYKVVLIHGGPGGAGTLKELSEILSSNYGILEPLQTADSVEGQIEELKQTLEQKAELPITLVGHSWGAMLGFIFAAKYPSYVQKLIMVSSGMFDAKYAKNIMETRLSRLSPEKKQVINDFMTKLNDSANISDELFHEFGELLEEVDCFESILSTNNHIIEGQYHIFKNVWPIAAKMRDTGELLAYGKMIQCPVIAIHGDYDPHPYQGVQEPLSKVLSNFSFILLSKCGHEPWIERHAKDEFFNIITMSLQNTIKLKK